jgi:hypothetical protein
VICAPSRYLESVRSDSAYQQRVSYEQIALWFSTQEGRRAAWRHAIVQEAIDGGRRGYVMAQNELITSFHFSYWDYLQKHHPRIHINRPGKRGNKSNWIIVKGIDFPRGVNIHHKLNQRMVEIGFPMRRIEELLAFKDKLPDDIRVVQKGRTPSLTISVPLIQWKGVSLSRSTRSKRFCVLFIA